MNIIIDEKLIRDSFGCDNCKHENDGSWDDYCRVCNPDYSPPSKYRPARNTIQEKLWYEGVSAITPKEYQAFLRNDH